MSGSLDITPWLDDLWRYGRVLTKNDADADDLVQEALARALSRAGIFDPARPMLPWLIAIVRNTYLTNLGRANAERRRIDLFHSLCSDVVLPSQELSAELLGVKRAMETLSLEHAEVLHLVAVLGFSYAEAAVVLGNPQGTVMSRLSRARTELQQALHAHENKNPSRLKLVGGRHAK